MPTTEVDGIEVYYRDQGGGPGVILLHSSASNGGQWRQLIERLSNRYRVLAPDFHGYGRTGPWPDERGSVLAGEVRIVETLLDEIGGNAHLVGHSYGGSVAGRVALAHPDGIASLVMIEPTLFYLLKDAGEDAAHDEIYGVAQAVIRHVDAGDPATAAKGFIDYWVGPGALTSMPPERREAVVATMTKLRQEWPSAFAAGAPSLAEFAAIEVPTLLIEATASTLAARTVVAVLRDAMAGSDHAAIDGAGHMSPVTHPEQVNPIIEAHIVRHS